MDALKIAIAGLGTVGAGIVRLLQDNREEITLRAGREIKIVAVSARNQTKDRGVDLSQIKWCDNPEKLCEQDIDVVVEVMGGEGGKALSLVRKSLEQGKAVVTANKALLAHHGIELATLSEAHNAPLLFEAAVAGGIPIIKILREGLAANRIDRLYGILNGTCNYILTTMQASGRDFADVLKEAQEKGYAEAEPSLDVDGWDAAHKLSLLAALAFGIEPNLDALTVRGIRDISAKDIQSADELGYRIKLIGQAYLSGDEIVQLVEPCLVNKNVSLANVHDVLNAVYTQGNHVGSSFVEGRGAGAGPTASAVVADLVDLARGKTAPIFGVPASALKNPRLRNPDEEFGEYYIRLVVLDRPGVIADITAILRDYQISIESLIQRGRDPGQPVTVVMTTHEAKRRDLNEAIERIAGLDSVAEAPLILQILSL